MRILGADSFSGSLKGTSINQIPSNYLTDGDMCIAKIKVGADIMIHYYRLDADSGLPQSLPNVIEPEDQLDNKRWLLTDLRVDKLLADEVLSSTYNPHISGGDTMVFNDNTFVLRPEMGTFNGQLTVTTSGSNVPGSYPPLVIDSVNMVENLNADMVDGYHATDFVHNNHRSIQIPYKATDISVTFYEPLASPNYSVWVSIVNVIDTDPSIYGMIVKEQTTNGFGVRFSGEIDTTNYILNYLLIGEVNT